MDEKTKLYIFSRSEVILIFLFVFLTALTSFIFGVRVGKQYSYTKVDHMTEHDHKSVELMSEKEEEVSSIIKSEDESAHAGANTHATGDSNLSHGEAKVDSHGEEKSDAHGASSTSPKTGYEVEKASQTSSGSDQKALLDDTYSKLREEFNKLDEEGTTTQKKNEIAQLNSDKGKVETPAAKKSEMNADVQMEPTSKKNEFSGKYSVQLGSYRSIDDAQKFANGFKIRGHNPIINEVDLKDKGIWYRVSIGAFETMKDAKNFVEQEKTLFLGTDFVIIQFE